MPLHDHIPIVERCCVCVGDLKTASAIIAVLAIVTSPLVSWAAVRHAYVIHVACVVTTSSARPDVVDINLSNILSFGFGANAGIGPSCLTRNQTNDATQPAIEESTFVQFVKYSGWVVLIADVVFLITSIHFLLRIFRDGDKGASKIFLIAALVSVLLSFIYGILYVAVCISVGGLFPVFELFFAVIDFMMWTYFLIVVYSYRRKST